MTKIGIMNPLHMVYGISYPWYFKPPNHRKAKPVCMVFWPPYTWYITNPLSMVYWAPYAWYIESSTHDISNTLSMVYRTPSYGIINPLPMAYRTPCSWYFDLPTHRTPSLGKNEEDQYVVNISYGILNPVSIFQGFKIPYDTCLWWR